MAFLIQAILFITFTHLIVGSGGAHCWSKANPLVGKDRCVRDTVVIGSMMDCYLQIHNRTMTRNWIAWNDRSTVVYFQEWNGHGSSKAFIHNESFEKWIFTILSFMSWNEDNDSNSKTTSNIIAMEKWFGRVKMKPRFFYSIIDYREQPIASKGIVHRNSHIVQRETIWFST